MSGRAEVDWMEGADELTEIVSEVPDRGPGGNGGDAELGGFTHTTPQEPPTHQRAAMTKVETCVREHKRPRLLDLFCCEGGAAMGYHEAGFDVFGVDLFEKFTQSRYPFPSAKCDAIAYVYAHGHEFDVIHASPPCWAYTAGTRALDRSRYPKLIPPTRAALRATRKPYVIENVEGAELVDPLVLCGTMFGLTTLDTDGTPLELWRHRQFESNIPLDAPCDCQHHAFSPQVAGCYGGARSDKDEARNIRHGGYVPKDKRVLQDLMGIDWMTKAGMYQALPPVYTQHIGMQLLDHIQAKEAAA